MKFKIVCLILVHVISSVAFSQVQCKDLFKVENQTQVEAQQQKLSRSKRKSLMTIIVEDEIRNYVASEMNHLSPEEKDELREKAQKFEKGLQSIQSRIDLYKKMTGSKRYRIIDENVTAANGEMNLLILGSFDQVFESLQKDFSNFEINYLLIQSLRADILRMNAESRLNNKILAEKLSELKNAEIKLGENFYTYIEVRNSIAELLKSQNEENQKLANELLESLREFAKENASKQILDYRPISIEEVEKFRNLNPNALRASYKKAAVREFITMLKMMTFSGPIVAAVKFVVFKLPENISLFGLSNVPLRKIIGDTFGISEKQHWRDLYIGPMNAIIRQNGYPDKQWQLLKDENALSPKRDELLVIFARVPENQKMWIEIKKYAKKVAKDNSFSEDFYNRMVEAEKAAIKAGDLPLHQQEAGATILGRVTLTSIVGYYGLQRYFTDNPNEFHDSVGYVAKFISFFTN